MEPQPPAARRRSATSTSNFGVGRRESHDSSGFYSRFRAPQLSLDESVSEPRAVSNPFVCGDARKMDEIENGSVALVVTSPPYFAGKEYEEELWRQGVPGTYIEYLGLLRDVFAECVRKLEPGGRIAVNVANLGRKPYRSLSADVIGILQDDLGLLLRGELIWQKAEGANGSCAWGSYRSAANPVLRDLSERVVVASKGRFDRAGSAKKRQKLGLPHESTLRAEDFMSLTLDIWSIPPESARRVGHPAPFPVELPEQLIRLYTFRGDLVLDPFMGSGSALVAAAQLGRRYIGYDLDPQYVQIAVERVRAATELPGDGRDQGRDQGIEGPPAVRLAEEAVASAGFRLLGRRRRIPRTGVVVDIEAEDSLGNPWYFAVAGPFTSRRGGMARAEVVWSVLGRAHALRGRGSKAPLVLLTSELPRRKSEGDAALRAASPEAFFDAVDLLADEGRRRLAHYAEGGPDGGPLPGFWTVAELGQLKST